MHIQRTYLLYHFFPAHNPYNINLYLSMNNIQVLDLEGNALTEPQERPMVESCAKTSQEVRKKRSHGKWRLEIVKMIFFSFLVFFFVIVGSGEGNAEIDTWIPWIFGYLVREKTWWHSFFLPEATPRCGKFFLLQKWWEKAKDTVKEIVELENHQLPSVSKKTIRN